MAGVRTGQLVSDSTKHGKENSVTTSRRFDHDVPMRIRDGVTLRADVFRPDDDDGYPSDLELSVIPAGG